ncbi:MAG: ABC transporter substrate-binding protein [Leptolyngbya sp. SIO4C1]|nr:ABC transporter substrate-binding protein [Leptolyngbya sp. SIO4C1]
MLSLNRIGFRSLALAAIGTTLISCGGEGTNTASSTDAPYIAVTQIVEHPALDAVRDGLKDELAAAGYEAGDSLKWEWESAQGQPATAAQIAQKFVGENPDLIVAIATPSAQAVAAANDDTPVVFSAVTDPVAAELVSDPNAPGGLITGVSDLSPIDQHMALIREVLPEAQRLGVIYSAGEANSVSLVELIKQEAPAQGFTDVVEATVSSSADVATAANSLVGKVDAIYIPTDNTVVSALESVLKVGAEQQIPIFAGDTDSVERGAIAGISFDYYDVGRQTGDVVLRILNGESPGEIPVETVDTVQLAVNPAAAEAMGVTLPEAVVNRADQVIE